MDEKTIQIQLPQSYFKLDQDQILYDVILQINDTQLYCHRIILAAFSPFFEAMFTNGMKESTQRLIVLKEIDSQAATDIIHYMYGKQLKITTQNAQLLAITASRFLVMPIVDECCIFISNYIDFDNFVEIYLFAETYRFQQIIDAVYQFMISNFKTCTGNNDFHQIPSSMLIRCLQSNKLCVPNEIDLLYILERWYFGHKPQCDEDTFVQMFESIRLSIIPIYDLIRFQQNTKLFDISIHRSDPLEKFIRFYLLPERNFSKYCQVNYRYYTKDFQSIHKYNSEILGIKTVYIFFNHKIVDYGTTFMNVEAIDRIYYAPIIIGHKLFLIGGMTEDKTKILNSIIAFDTTMSEWVRPKLPSLPNPTAGLSACLDDNRLYIIGGYNRNENIACKEVAYLESGSDDWVRVRPMNIARKYSKACALDHFIYVLGGDNNSNCNSLERYNPTTDTWELLLSNTNISITHCSTLVAFEGKLYYVENLSHCYQYDPLQNKVTSHNCDRSSKMRLPHIMGVMHK